MRHLKVLYRILKGIFIMATGAAIYLSYLIAFPYITERILSLPISHAHKEGLSLLIAVIVIIWFFIFEIRGGFAIFNSELGSKKNTATPPPSLSNPAQ